MYKMYLIIYNVSKRAITKPGCTNNKPLKKIAPNNIPNIPLIPSSKVTSFKPFYY